MNWPAFSFQISSVQVSQPQRFFVGDELGVVDGMEVDGLLLGVDDGEALGNLEGALDAVGR